MVVLIGLTGGIACGKSTVSKQLATAHNITIIDADDIVRQLQGPGTTCTRKIADIWPEVVSPTTGELNRALLGRIVFSDSNARRQLGRIMNKPIFLAILKAIFMAWWADILSRVGVGSGTAKRVVVLDAPTLFETRWFVPLVSNTVVVSCSPALQKQRLLARPNPLHQNARLSVEEAEDRIRSQMPLDLKKKMAGYVLENNGDLLELEHQVERSLPWMERQPAWRLDLLFGAPLLAGIGLLTTALWFATQRTVEAAF